MTGRSNGSSGVGDGVDDREIGREDLQLMLRPRLGNRALVLGCSVLRPLLPPGENFACSLYKLEARVRRDEAAPEEELQLVAKLFPSSNYVRNLFDFGLFFEKELFFYQRLLPQLKQLDEEFGARPGEAIDLAPELFGARSSADLDKEDVDEGVVLLLDNLKSKGYYTGDKREGLDIDHSRAALKALARFHGYVIACKQHRPEFFSREVVGHARPVPYKDDESFNLMKLLTDMMLADDRFAEHRERLAGALCRPESKRLFFEYVAEEPWLGLAHFDFWTNNVLFRRGPDSEIADVKFVDFQNYTHNSPLRDLPYFLCTSTTSDVMARHFDELIDYYYAEFLATLKRTGCDASPFNRESFDRQLKIDAGLEFFHNVLGIKFFSAEIDPTTYDPSQLDKVVLCSQINKFGLDKWYQILLIYIQHGWL